MRRRWSSFGSAASAPRWTAKLRCLPGDAEAVQRLMDMDEMAAAFWDRATGPVAALALEGNG